MSEAQIIGAWIAFACSYLVFAIGKFPGLRIDRPGAAIVGAVVMVAIKVVSPANAIRSVDFSTIVLLFAMMLVVATLRLSGFFDLVAEHLVAHLEPAHLLPAVIFTSGLLSGFFVNDIVCLVLGPFVILISRRMRLNPVPHLLALATASNIGSVATITGNPQNMLIGSYSGISYRSFLAHLAPVAIAGLFVDWLVLWWLWHGKLASRETAGASQVGHKGFPKAHATNQLIKPILVMAAVLIGFLLGVPPAMMAALGAAALLVIHARDTREMYDEVDWGLLVFFVGLFVIVRGAEESGLVARLLSGFQFLNLHRPAPFSAVVVALSNLVSNVPAVMLLKSLVPQFSNPRGAWLMLAMASTLAGNLTITGSVANIIVVESAREMMRAEPDPNPSDAHIGFREYGRVGVPVTVLTVALGTLWVWWTS
nr:putative transporter [uncultured bacterium]